MQSLKFFRRMLALVLTAATLLTVVPTGLPTAHAADYQDPYLNQMVEWGFLRGDIEGNLRPDSNITRAEFVTIVNRAFGYTRTGDMPFTDVEIQRLVRGGRVHCLQCGIHTGHLQEHLLP